MTKWTRVSNALTLAAAVLLTAGAAQAQQESSGRRERFLRVSQASSVSQTVNTTEITVRFSRLGARGRELFGALVDWDKRWMPGANEATTIEFSKPVWFGGEEVEAGKYSVWTIPREDRWTVMLHNEWDTWHRPYPAEGEVVLDVDVEPTEAQHVELLTYAFPDVGASSATLTLQWGTTLIAIPIEVEEELKRRP